MRSMKPDKAVRVEEISEGQAIVRQDDQGHEAFVVARGILKVVRSNGGDETLLAQLGPGAMFGEMALLSGGRRTADVVAVDFCQLQVLERRDFNLFTARHPALRAAVSDMARERSEMNKAHQPDASEPAAPLVARG